MDQEQNFTEIRSDEIQELMSQPPQWMLRWGITVMFSILLLLAACAWVIHYPDLVPASFKLTASNAPKAVVARSEGKVIRLFVKEGQEVNTDQPLIYIESTAQHAEVLQLILELKDAWRNIHAGNLERLSNINFNKYHQLGELQAAYQVFEQAHIKLRAYLAGGFYSQKKAVLQHEIADLQQLAQQLKSQRVLQARDAKLAQEEYEAQQRLAIQKVIPALELKKEESKNISRQLAYQQTASTLLNNTTAQREKQKEILELDKQVGEERDQFLQALNTLQSAAEAWKSKYIILSPVSGSASFVGNLQENQVVKLGQEILYVSPPSTSYIGELRVPQRSAGKVKTGQTVLIKFAGFPYQEYGSVKGHIISISSVAYKDSVFLAQVALNNGLRTTFGTTLSFRSGMTASAEVVTADNRLLERLFYQVESIIHPK